MYNVLYYKGVCDYSKIYLFDEDLTRFSLLEFIYLVLPPTLSIFNHKTSQVCYVHR